MPSQSHAPSAIPPPLQTPHSSNCPTQSSTSSQTPSASTSSHVPPSSPPDSPHPAVKSVPPAPENTNALKQSCVTFPSRTVNVKLSPAGRTDPVNEKPNTTVPLADTVNPAA